MAASLTTTDVLRASWPPRKQSEGGPTDLLEIMRQFVAECTRNVEKERSASVLWNRSSYFLGALSAVLATLVGATSLGDSFKPAFVAGFALLSASLTTLVTFLKSDDKHQQHLGASAAWESLAGEARILIATYALTVERDGGDVTIAALNKYSPELERLNLLKGQLMRNEIPAELTGDKPPLPPPPEQLSPKLAS